MPFTTGDVELFSDKHVHVGSWLLGVVYQTITGSVELAKTHSFGVAER